MKKLFLYFMLILILSSFLMGSMPLTDNSQHLQPLCLLAGRVTDYDKYKQTTNIFFGEYTGEYTFLGTTLYIKLKIKSQLFGILRRNMPGPVLDTQIIPEDGDIIQV